MQNRLPGLTYRTWDSLFGGGGARCARCSEVARNALAGQVLCNACFDVACAEKMSELDNCPAGDTEQ